MEDWWVREAGQADLTQSRYRTSKKYRSAFIKPSLCCFSSYLSAGTLRCGCSPISPSELQTGRPSDYSPLNSGRYIYGWVVYWREQRIFRGILGESQQVSSPICALFPFYTLAFMPLISWKAYAVSEAVFPITVSSVSIQKQHPIWVMCTCSLGSSTFGSFSLQWTLNLFAPGLHFFLT